jgi:hypothetical protein
MQLQRVRYDEGSRRKGAWPNLKRYSGIREYAVTQLVEALRSKPEVAGSIPGELRGIFY